MSDVVRNVWCLCMSSDRAVLALSRRADDSACHVRQCMSVNKLMLSCMQFWYRGQTGGDTTGR